MKLSIFTTITNPSSRGDNYRNAINCYSEFAHEVIFVDGGVNAAIYRKDTKKDEYKFYALSYPWPEEFSWEFIGQQFQRGYEACTGDWVIHADLDFVFHEKDFAAIRKALQDNNDAPAVSLLKRQFILPDRFNLKSRLVIAVNKGKYGDRIRFDSGGDLCQPSLDGEYIEPGTVPDIKIPFYNYEKLIKTEAQIKDDVGRMARAWQRHFGKYRLGGPDDESAYQEWLHMVVGRFKKPSEHIKLDDHPKYVQETIASLKPEQWGYSGFGHLERNSYA